MSRLTFGIFGALALSLILGAAQLALGRDLSEAAQAEAAHGRLRDAFQEPLVPGGTEVNRASKADRVLAAAGSPGKTRTISVQPDGVADLSLLVRVPIANSAGHSSPVPFDAKDANRKPTVACEPMVSVLTEIAKTLQPGRCVT